MTASITIAPTWRGILPALVAVAHDAETAKARTAAWSELYRLADIADQAAGVDRTAPPSSSPAIVYLLEAEHFTTPGFVQSVHASREAAKTEAASLVNLLLEYVSLPRDATPDNWESKLKEAKEKCSEHYGEEASESGYVSINAYQVKA